MITFDKSKQLNSTITLVNEKLNFIGNTGANDPVSIDYTPPLGDNLGYTSLELFLRSFSSCVGSAVLVLFKQKEMPVVHAQTNIVLLPCSRYCEKRPIGFPKVLQATYHRPATC